MEKTNGSERMRIINERTVATLALAVTTAEGNLPDTFDISGQTFGVSLPTIDDGVFEVKATSGGTVLARTLSAGW